MFNPRARWDRELPNSSNDLLNEIISVSVFFEKGKIIPQSFVWRKNLYQIKQITYFWQERQGSELVSFFSVDTGTDIYQLSFNNNSFGWRLDKIINSPTGAT
ncbi:MAG: hypothetical protein FJZ11_07575 [Candidatus Omnitrophica bacterium]|nr:hypothetical protein [Candidatus Omnitrophota bacterium]